MKAKLMKVKQLQRVFAGVTSLFFMVMAASVYAEQNTLVLFSEEEAAQLNDTALVSSFEMQAGLNQATASSAAAPDADGDVAIFNVEQSTTHASQAVNNGPNILIEKPLPIGADAAALIKTTSPSSLVITFAAKDADVDMSTLQITASKGMFSKSLTPMVKPYVKGNRLEAERIEVPEGNFRINIAVSDIHGNITRQSYGLVVSGD